MPARGSLTGCAFHSLIRRLYRLQKPNTQGQPNKWRSTPPSHVGSCKSMNWMTSFEEASLLWKKWKTYKVQAPVLDLRSTSFVSHLTLSAIKQKSLVLAPSKYYRPIFHHTSIQPPWAHLMSKLSSNPHARSPLPP